MPPAYEILLLNTAIPQIQAAQSGDTYVVPRDIAFSAALTLSAGTANGVPYLNASKVLTTGSALTFDGTNFANTLSANASAGLRVTNSNAGASTSANTAYSNGAETHEFGILGTAYGGYGVLAARDAYIYASTSRNISLASDGGAIKFGAGTGAVEQMRLTSTGLGIGTNNPAYKLDLSSSNDGYGRQWIAAVGYPSSADNSVGFQIRNLGAGVSGLKIANYANSVEWMRLDSSGNLGLGVTPSAWGASSQALQNGGGSFFQYNNDRVFIGQNTYIDTSFGDRFIGDGYATRYRQYQGTHVFYVSTVSNSSGAGASQSFTQAMTLDASGNLLVGETASNSGNNGLKVKGQFALTTAQTFTASGSVNDSAYYIVCYALSATCTLTLPTPANNTGRLLNIVVQSAQQVVSASSNVTAIADGAVGTAILPATAGKWAQLWCDGAYWNIIATNV